MKRFIITSFLTASSLLASFAQGGEQTPQAKPVFSRTLSECVTTPKFGGYFIGKYGYSDQDGKHGGDGFRGSSASMSTAQCSATSNIASRHRSTTPAST